MRVANNTEWLFSQLWKKNPETSQSCPNLNVVETILFRWAQPYFWYSSTKDGALVRKTKDKVVLTQIEETFMHNMSKCGVVATCLNSQEDTNFKNQEKIEFEYIDQPSFHNFLFQKEKPMNLIMQKFLEPKGNKNALIKVSWTPQFCIFFRKTNINDLTNTKIPLVNRLTTFEGAEHLSASDSISTSFLVAELEQTCLNIVKHIQGVTNGNTQISKMVLYFKLDERNRLWLLFCTSLKFKEKVSTPGRPVVAKKKNQRPLSPLLTVNSKKEEKNPKVLPHPQYIYDGQPSEVNTECCLKCGSDGLLYDLKMKLVLEYDQRIMHDQVEPEENHDTFMDRYRQFEELEKKKNPNVPDVIRKLYPHMTEEKYIKLKTNPSFMNMPVKLCENCHTLVIELAPETEERRGKNIKLKIGDRSPRTIDSPFGTVRELDALSPNKEQYSAPKSPWEGSLSPTRYYSNSSRSAKFTNQVLSRHDSKPHVNKASAFSFQAQAMHAQLAQGNIEQGQSGQRPKSGFPYLESFREKDAFASMNIPVKEHYFRATSGFNSPKETGTARTKNAVSPYAYEMNIISPQISHRKLSCRPATAVTVTVKKSQMGQKLSDILVGSPKEKGWSTGKNAKKVSRTNYTSMMSTIKDMKWFLEQNME